MADLISDRIGKTISVSLVEERSWNNWLLIAWRSDGLLLNDPGNNNVFFIPWHQIHRVAFGRISDEDA